MNEKFNWKRFSIVMAIVIFAAGATAGPLWYFMDQNNKSQQETIDSLQKQLNQITENQETEKDEAADWKTYKENNGIYSIKYPSDWFYKDDYDMGEANRSLVAFGETKRDLPAPETDQISAIGINFGIKENEIPSSNYTASATVEISKVFIGDKISAIKVVLLPGRENDMYGDSKIIYYEIKTSKGYILINQFEDYEQDNFDLMLKNFKLL